MSINENQDKAKSIVIETWDPNKKEMLMVEATEKMRGEIERQKEIMRRATNIFEGKGSGCVDKDCAKTQKTNIKKQKGTLGNQLENGGDPFTEEPQNKTPKTNIKPSVNENEELIYNDNPDYMDMSNGTEIGDGKPFGNCPKSNPNCNDESIEEGVSMHSEGDNQNKPKPGVGEIGDSDPFIENVNESIEDLTDDDSEFGNDFDDDSIDDEDLDADDTFDTEDDFEDDMDDVDTDFDDVDDDVDDVVDDVKNDELEDRISSIEELLNKIASKLGVGMFDDDELYPEDSESNNEDSDSDDEDFDSDDEDFDSDDETEFEYEFDEEESDMENDTIGECIVIETPNYKKLMRENEEYFGKHPAYRKEPMKHLSAKHQEQSGYYDMNDESAENETEYGVEIGDGNPFNLDPKEIENAVVESVMKVLKRKNQ